MEEVLRQQSRILAMLRGHDLIIGALIDAHPEPEALKRGWLRAVVEAKAFDASNSTDLQDQIYDMALKEQLQRYNEAMLARYARDRS